MSNNIRKLRKRANMTQSRLGEKLGVQDSAISKYESGKLPLTDDTLRKLAEIFNVTTDYILNIEPYTNTTPPELTKKEIHDIKNDLEKIIAALSNKQNYIYFDGESVEDLDMEDRILLITSLEHTMKLAKRLTQKRK